MADRSRKTSSSFSRITRTRSRSSSKELNITAFPPPPKGPGIFRRFSLPVAAGIIYDPTQPDVRRSAAAVSGKQNHQPEPHRHAVSRNMPKCNLPNPATCDQATADVQSEFFLPGLDPLKAHRFDVRMDWAKSERQRIFGRFSYDKLIFSTANVFPAPGWDIDYAQNVTNGRNVLVADDLTLNSSTVLNLRYSFTRHFENQGGPPSYLSTNLTSLGFPASLAAQEVFKQLPFIIFSDVGGGVGGTADYNNFVYASMNSDASATITKVRGKHELSFGFEWMKRYLNVGQPPAPAGSYLFDVSATDQTVASVSGGSDYASTLIGMGTAGSGSETSRFIPASPKTSSPPSPIPTTRPLLRIRSIHVQSSDHHRRPALGHLRRTERALQPPGIL